MELILDNIITLWIIFFLLVGIRLAWKIKPMRYSLIASLIIVFLISYIIKTGGLTIEKIIAKSGYIALFIVWFTVLIVFIVGMYKLWNNYGKNGSE